MPFSQAIFIRVFTAAACFLLFFSCSTLPINVQKALEQSGKNRTELEKVIEHYKNEPQKLKAAYFLIGNMPGKYGIYREGGKPDSSFVEACREILYNASCADMLDTFILNERYKLEQALAEYPPRRIEDVKIITSDFLIENIELAFELWKTKPWASSYGFEEFCEWILPYRVGEEPIQSWRPFFLKQLSALGNNLNEPSNVEEICQKVNSYIADRYLFSPHLDILPERGAVDLFSTSAGTCDQRYVLVTYAMRSMGIPVAIDFTPQFSHWPGNHSWTALLLADKSITSFNGGEKNAKFFSPAVCPIAPDGGTVVASVFRFIFENKTKQWADQSNEIPAFFKTPHFKDVSHQYPGQVHDDFVVPLHKNPKRKYAVLYAFSKGLDMVPVKCAEVTDGYATFTDVGYGDMYIYAVAENIDGKLMFDNQPFEWDGETGKAGFMAPDIYHTEEVTLYRKYPVKYTMQPFVDGITGAQIQGSNSRDFEHFDVLYAFGSNQGEFAEFRIESTKKYRYFRYTGSDSDIRIADVALYSDNSGSKKRIDGHVFGYLPDRETCDGAEFENAFDNNIRTNFNAPKGSWVAIDAGTPVEVSSVKIMARNHFNIVEKGDVYQLLYFDTDWYVIGEKVAEDNFIRFENVPSDALLLLRNKTKGKEERVFIYKDSIQEFL